MTRLLQAWNEGDEGARDRLIPDLMRGAAAESMWNGAWNFSMR